MKDIEFTLHTRDMLQERNIPEEWVLRAVETPDSLVAGEDGNFHYVKAIPEHGGRFLRVVVNRQVTPWRVVTVFFDRRLRR